MRYSVLFHDDNRISGDVPNFEFLKMVTNSINNVQPIKCCTVFFDDDKSEEFE